MLSREHGIGTEGATELTMSILKQRAACVSGFEACESHFSNSGGAHGDTRQCLSECGSASAACKKYISRRDAAGGSSSFREYAKESQRLLHLCKGLSGAKNSVHPPPHRDSIHPPALKDSIHPPPDKDSVHPSPRHISKNDARNRAPPSRRHIRDRGLKKRPRYS